MASTDEKEYFHVSKKKRNTQNALNKKRKNIELYEHIREFDYNILQTIEQEEEEEFEKNKQEQKPWATLVGRVSLIYFIILDFKIFYRMEKNEWKNYWIKLKLQ
jgi:predicted class III extradiol MEMO1 family dioxygenase